MSEERQRESHRYIDKHNSKFHIEILKEVILAIYEKMYFRNFLKLFFISTLLRIMIDHMRQISTSDQCDVNIFLLRFNLCICHTSAVSKTLRMKIFFDIMLKYIFNKKNISKRFLEIKLCLKIIYICVGQDFEILSDLTEKVVVHILMALTWIFYFY